MSRKSPKVRRAAPAAATAPRAIRFLSNEITEVQRRILREAGKDPNAIPDVPFRYMKMSEVGEALGLSTSSLYRAIAAGKIPKPVSLEGLMQSDG
jgi:predicted DNA-binding transcriptional regulator AlpA